MNNLSNNQRLALAKQFNLIVRAINGFQLAHWAERDEKGFNELIRKERVILSHVERLLDRSTVIIADEPSSLVLDVENFSEDLRMQLKYSKLNQTLDLISRTIILVSSILGFAPEAQNTSEQTIFELYVA